MRKQRRSLDNWNDALRFKYASYTLNQYEYESAGSFLTCS
jgi:hypothetical protein